MTNRICRLFERRAAKTHTRQGKGSKRTKREASFIRPVLCIWGAPSCKVQCSIIFYSHVDSNYRLFPMVKWMHNFFLKADGLTVTEQPLLFGQRKSRIFFFSSPDSQESLFLQLFSSVFLVLTHFLFLDRFYFPAHILCILNALYLLQPWPFSGAKDKGENTITCVFQGLQTDPTVKHTIQQCLNHLYCMNWQSRIKQKQDFDSVLAFCV